MRHFFNIEVRTIADTICNRKEFTIKVAGLSILVSWPWMSAKTFFKHTAKPRMRIYLLSREDTNAGSVKISSLDKFSPESLHVKTRILAGLTQNLESKVKHTIFTRIFARFDERGISSQFKANCANALLRLKIALFGSGKAHQNIRTVHSAVARLGNFRKIRDLDFLDISGDLSDNANMTLLSQLDYNDEGIERTLVDIENK